MRRHFNWDKTYVKWGMTAFCVIAASLLFYFAVKCSDIDKLLLPHFCRDVFAPGWMHDAFHPIPWIVWILAGAALAFRLAEQGFLFCQLADLSTRHM